MFVVCLLVGFVGFGCVAYFGLTVWIWVFGVCFEFDFVSLGFVFYVEFCCFIAKR